LRISSDLEIHCLFDTFNINVKYRLVKPSKAHSKLNCEFSVLKYYELRKFDGQL